MFNLFTNEFRKKEIYLFFLFMLFVSAILITMFASLEGATDGVVMAYESSMLIATFSISTYYYKKYDRKDFLDTSYLSGQSKTKIKINIFLYIVFWLFIFSLATFALAYFLFWLNVLDINGISLSGGGQKLFPTINQINWLFLFYCIFMYIFLMLGSSIVINSIFKDSNLLYGIIMIIFICNFRYSYTMLSPLSYNADYGFFELSSSSSTNVIRHKNSIYFFPWDMIGIRLTEVFNQDTYVHGLTFYQYYNLSNIEQFKNFQWLPYLYILIFFSFSIFYSEFKSRN